MHPFDLERIAGRSLTRREFIWLSGLVSAALASGCATNPVTGESQLMLVSEQEEIKIDRQYAPLQFSSDFGAVQQASLNDYVSRVGKAVAARSHRIQMPYSFRVVNANYINAYAFPGGSIACTRGILLGLDSEAELAALLGHEIGHVNARHTAASLSKGMLTQAIVGGISVVADVYGAGLGQIASALGSIGGGALLAAYSRDNERQADALGTEYMVASGYGPDGMVGLMEMLNGLNKSKPSTIELMFATHPMSDERYRTALDTVRTRYAASKGLPLYRERYMDQTAPLRALKGPIEEMQKGEKLLAKKKYDEAETHFRSALKAAPNDYTALVEMATCQLMQKQYAEALRFADQAKGVYPQEAQGHHLAGFARLNTGDYGGAYRDFSASERILPGNPHTIFFQGLSQEKMNHRPEAARDYNRYLQQVREGKYAQYAHQRLREWGYAR
jgi:predicted Zn-dependent protease